MLKKQRNKTKTKTMRKCLRNVLQNLKYFCLGLGGVDEMLGSHQFESLDGFQWIPPDEKHVFQTHSVCSFCINQVLLCVPLLRGNCLCLLRNVGHNFNVYSVKRNVRIVNKHSQRSNDLYSSLVSILFNTKFIFMYTKPCQVQADTKK